MDIFEAALVLMLSIALAGIIVLAIYAVISALSLLIAKGLK
jgi:hypothetical protein